MESKTVVKQNLLPLSARGFLVGLIMKDLYKVYDPEGKSLTFKSLSELKALFNLDKEDVKQCFLHRVYTTKDGIEIIHYF